MNSQQIAAHLMQNSCRMFKGRTCHPEPEAIREIVLHARAALLPNYFEPQVTETHAQTIDRLHQVLTEQIHRASYQECIHKGGTEETRRTAAQKSTAFVEQLPLLQDMLYEDVMETLQGDPAATGPDEIILTYPGILALGVYRAAHELVKLGVPLLPRMMTEYAHRLTGVDLHPGATIGRSIMIDHGTGIVVGETAVVGNHVKIYQGVTLGALYFPKDEQGMMLREVKRHPTVEDYVILYSNSTVLGGETVIGHHSVIGSNTWVTRSVPPYSKVTYETESVVRTREAH
ncbi:serine acetyltransferase [Alicyclobacillus fastidiosus]|uniref:Serine acetyltransferase n=1 Tax=Alicyclobacillus fastidiosus TaxID=392011 RepID=A0ABY6ZK32_9BACL|nr:serine acetyltransferase [Alicyclobacillus fastidiosus]WAH42862.1 serine acetyltransferase [Alicyclobacillus fastidiosus]GMA64797.1 serine acetyltransferase [Alicyclobacillus fastidiosus]